MSDLDRLIAHEDIRQLVERYSVAVGARALDVVAELFVEDVVAGPGQRGRDALLAVYEQMLPPGGVTILLVTSHVIDLLAADHAEGIVYCLCETGTEEQWMRQIIAYEGHLHPCGRTLVLRLPAPRALLRSGRRLKSAGPGASQLAESKHRPWLSAI